MRIKLSGLLIFVFAFSSISVCNSLVVKKKINSKIDTNHDQDSVILESKILLVYYEKSGNYYDYYIKVLPGETFILLAEFETLPADVIWDTINHQVHFVTQEGVLMKNYLSKEEEFQKLSDPLPEGLIGMFNSAWIDKETGEVCFSYGINVDQTNLAKYQKLEKLADYLPEWGGEVIVGILKVNKSGQWETIVEKASKCCAGMTPGLSVLDDYIKINDKYISTSAIINNSMCFYGVKGNTELLMDTDLEKYFIGDEVHSSDAFFLAKLNDSISLIVSAAWGDTPHNISPCYFWDNNKSKLEEIILNTNTDKSYHHQLGMQITKDYLLIASEYQHESPKIFDIRTLQEVYDNPEASHAFILENE
ncbi:MAG TPA: hypothetical protein PLL66_03510 [Bacteroidales bacterium]|nr:hypothetical protein [Bacteroidales bacterium]